MTPKGNLIAKLLASSALVLTSGAYVYSQQISQAPVREVSTPAAPRIVARVERSAPQSTPPTPSVAPAPAPTAPLEKSPLANAPAPQIAPREETPLAVPPSDTAVAPPVPQEAPAPPPNETALAAPPPRTRLADGDFTGEPADCQWGTVQVEVRVQGGAVAQVNFLQVPDHRRRSAEISDWTMPILAQEAIKAQSGDVDLVSGATATSFAFQQAFSSALTKAKR